MRSLTSLAAILFLAAALATLPGCQIGYLFEQGLGELSLSWGAVEIGEGPEIPPRLPLEGERRQGIERIYEIRRFARDQLGLEVGDAYTTYYDTGGRPVSYAVSAAHPLALVPYRWTFPIAGKVSYKGFFDRDSAHQEQARLASAGWDTHVSPVAAFSTLGWFRDPILPSMLELPEGDLAELLIHELVHRTIYFENSSALNESLATAVSRAGTRMFLAAVHGEGSRALEEYRENLAQDADRNEVFNRLRSGLESLYASSLPDGIKLRRKRELFAAASRTLARLQPWSPRLELPVSNALVLSRGQYLEHVRLLEDLMEDLGGHPRDLIAFLKGQRFESDPLAAIERAIASRRSAPRRIPETEGSGS